jgi:hypothetical protein
MVVHDNDGRMRARAFGVQVQRRHAVAQRAAQRQRLGRVVASVFLAEQVGCEAAAVVIGLQDQAACSGQGLGAPCRL